MIDFNDEERWYRVQERDIKVAMQRITSTEQSRGSAHVLRTRLNKERDPPTKKRLVRLGSSLAGLLLNC